MANTYTQIIVQFVFAVKNRKALILPNFKDTLCGYITGIVQNNSHKLLAIYCMPDHVHILTGMKPNQSLADLMRDVKASSAKWVNDGNFLKSRFEWQSGYGAFTYSNWDVQKLIHYVLNQEEHHRKTNFQDEDKELLKENKIDYNDQYLFTDPE